MSTVSDSNFGPLIAYLIPGATAIAGFIPASQTLRSWFALSATDAPTIGGFLYLTLAALAAGMTISAIRWAIVDSLHSWTGLRPPAFNFSRLGNNVEALRLLIDIHYRHYQFYANMLIACCVAYVGYRMSLGSTLVISLPDVAFAVIEIIFFAASRDTLRKYYRRGEQVLAGESRRATRGS